jgi:hypothetical protein
MSAKKVNTQLPTHIEFTLHPSPEGVTVSPRVITEEELTSADHVRLIITQENTRFRNQYCYVGNLYRGGPEPTAMSVVSQNFSKKGDPVTRADSFYKVLGAAVASVL